jgi:hypothetical protein
VGADFFREVGDLWEKEEYFFQGENLTSLREEGS